MIKDQEQLKIIESFLDASIGVVLLEGGEMWTYTLFVEANGKDRFYHQLTGKCITFLSEASNIANDREILLTRLNSLPDRAIWLHADIKFMCFVTY